MFEKYIAQAVEIGIIFTATFLFAGIVRKAFEKIVSYHTSTSSHHFSYIKHLISALIYLAGLTAVISVFPSLRAIAVSMFASAGVLAIVIGFAAQQAFSNIVSGIFIIVFKPFRVGDRVKMEPEISGIIEDIALRHTVIRNFENKRFIIPNSVIGNAIIENSSFGDEKICKFVDFGIGYDSDVDKAIKIIQEEAKKHPNFLDNRTPEEIKRKEDAVSVRVIAYGDFAVQLRAWVWSSTPSNAFVMGCDLNKSIKKRFDKEGIEIPYPYRTIVYKNKKKMR